MQRSENALIRFEQATNLPMLLLALLFTAIIALPELVDLSAASTLALEAVELVLYAVFVLEIAIRLYLAPHRLRYAATHWFDILIILIPIFRPLSAARSLRAARLLRGLRIVGPLARSALEIRDLFKHRGVAGGLMLALFAVCVCSVAVWRVESNSEGPIRDLPDAVWWALTTVTTVGYGDTYPVTHEGRAIGVMLMLIGIGVFGTVTASVAAFFVEASEANELTEIREALARIEARLEQPQPE